MTLTKTNLTENWVFPIFREKQSGNWETSSLLENLIEKDESMKSMKKKISEQGTYPYPYKLFSDILLPVQSRYSYGIWKKKQTDFKFFIGKFT